MKIVSLILLSLCMAACAGSTQFHAPQQGQESYGERSFLICNSLQGQFTCGNEYASTTVASISPGVFEVRNRKGDRISSERVESPCLTLEPTGVMQCGFAAGALEGSSADLHSGVDWHSIKLTLIAPDRVQFDVKGAPDQKHFSQIFPYPLNIESRTYLATNGIPKSLIAGLR